MQDISELNEENAFRLIIICNNILFPQDIYNYLFKSRRKQNSDEHTMEIGLNVMKNMVQSRNTNT